MPCSPSSASESDVGLRGYRVVGLVQGVGFRHWTRRTAERLGLSGTVRNLPDGSVEVHAAGIEESLRRFEEALRDGPPAARVERVEALTPRADTPRSGFSLKH
ncbi:MAG: acylphosphatase [Gemmatimonadetes bacterium]|nr:acylphosphatase [Gemmatimonadota bacterium]MSR35042.1 acylphosphatase [Gemmatimonadota bacterium]